jgi:hypothetical protein
MFRYRLFMDKRSRGGLSRISPARGLGFVISLEID